MASFLENLEFEHEVTVDPRNRKWIQADRTFALSKGTWLSFFRAASADRLTSVRAFALLAKMLKERGVALFSSGVQFQTAIQEGKVNLGLSLPHQNIGAVIWDLDPGNPDPEFQAHLRLFYTKPFTHDFGLEVLSADLKVGTGKRPETYWWEGQEMKHFLVEADIYYGERQGVGFRNIRGIAAKKRGMGGMFQKVAFFATDAISAITIEPAEGRLVADAALDAKIPDFETTPAFWITIPTQVETPLWAVWHGPVGSPTSVDRTEPEKKLVRRSSQDFENR